MKDEQKLGPSNTELVEQIIRDQRKLEIQQIFAVILIESQGKTSLIARAKPYDIKQLLEYFRTALITEVTNESIHCDHPTRIAVALKALDEASDEEFHAKLEQFKMEVNNSKLYPTTHYIATSIGEALGLAISLVALVWIMVAGSMADSGVYVGAAFLISAIIAVPVVFLISVPIRLFSNADMYRDVYDVKEKGMNLCKLLPISATLEASQKESSLVANHLGLFAPERIKVPTIDSKLTTALSPLKLISQEMNHSNIYPSLDGFV